MSATDTKSLREIPRLLVRLSTTLGKLHAEVAALRTEVVGLRSEVNRLATDANRNAAVRHVMARRAEIEQRYTRLIERDEDAGNPRGAKMWANTMNAELAAIKDPE